MPLKVDAEVKLDSEPCLLAWSERLYVGTEDGSIKSFDASLSPAASWSAHAAQLFALEAGGGRVYSASNDGGARVWSAAGERLAELPGSGADVGVLRLCGDELYAGDEGGTVFVFEKDSVKAVYSVLEEVKDILVSRPFMLTVRDLDVTVTQIKPGSSKTQFVTRHTMEGRGPLRRVGGAEGAGGEGGSLLLVSRDGRSLRLHDNSIDTQYKLLHEQKASEMILTSLAVGAGGVAWSAGWDGRVRRWKVDAGALAPAGELDLGACVSSLCCPDGDDVVYAAVAGGRVVRVRA